MPIDQNRKARDIRQIKDIDSVKSETVNRKPAIEVELSSLVDAFGHTAACSTILISFRKEIYGVGVWVNHGRASNANVVRHIGTSYIALQERRLNLTSFNQGSSDCINCADPVLIACSEDKLLAPWWCVNQGFGIPELCSGYHVSINRFVN